MLSQINNFKSIKLYENFLHKYCKDDFNIKKVRYVLHK